MEYESLKPVHILRAVHYRNPSLNQVYLCWMNVTYSVLEIRPTSFSLPLTWLYHLLLLICRLSLFSDVRVQFSRWITSITDGKKLQLCLHWVQTDFGDVLFVKVLSISQSIQCTLLPVLLSCGYFHFPLWKCYTRSSKDGENCKDYRKEKETQNVQNMQLK